ncbi:hypothetical protein F5B18DRAFT_599509 [Nemania serpens]|nr:hypothetical protein F5B18DRAFT_599509 [Nemania serpens]
MSHVPFELFRYQERPLGNIPESLEACTTPQEQMAFIVNKLRLCVFNQPRHLLDQTQTVLRLFEAKEIWRRGLKINAPFTLMEARHFTAIAYYMFTGNPAPNPCRQCTSTRSSGPAQDCIVAADLSGACTNCYYSGAGHACSIRVETEKEAAKQQKRGHGFTEFTEEMLEEATSEQLRRWKRVLEKELSERTAYKSPNEKQS